MVAACKVETASVFTLQMRGWETGRGDLGMGGLQRGLGPPEKGGQANSIQALFTTSPAPVVLWHLY